MGNAQDDPVLPGRFGQHLITPTKQNGPWFERAVSIAEPRPSRFMIFDTLLQPWQPNRQQSHAVSLGKD
jgi:hypothetical protein